jgi:gliding motility-associated lipoprotein GldH
MKKIFLLVFAGITILSCDKQKVYEEFMPIEGKTWSSKNVLKFNVNIKDTVASYHVLISVRNTGEYEFSNLFLFVTASSPNGNIVRDTVEIILADERGKWLGKGAASVYTLYYPYQQNIRFPVSGIYQFDVEQAMWVRDLKHINDIGLRVEKAVKPN